MSPVLIPWVHLIKSLHLKCIASSQSPPNVLSSTWTLKHGRSQQMRLASSPAVNCVANTRCDLHLLSSRELRSHRCVATARFSPKIHLLASSPSHENVWVRRICILALSLASCYGILITRVISATVFKHNPTSPTVLLSASRLFYYL